MYVFLDNKMLPYNNIGEAEVDLNRSLSYAERLWLNYSANKSDYYLYWHNIVFFYLVLLFIPLPLVLVELFGANYVERYKIQPKVKISFDEILSCFKAVCKVYFFTLGPLHLLFYLPAELIGIRTRLELPSAWEISIQIFVYFLIEDYTNYWLHRFLHCKWCYEKIHKVHHEYTAPNSCAAPYAHWAEILISGAPSFLGPAIVPCHIITFWLWMVFRQIQAIETHCGYNFPWSPAKYIPFYGGAEHHDYHHYVGGQSRSNFATVFTYCDYIYGTYKGYQYQKNLLADRAKGRFKAKGDGQ